jgi:NAD(P)H-dependent flavin oxidoreductase YrpB (nitropropane dioxygenase family)
MEDWTPTARQLPPDGVVVEAMDSGGHVQPLKRAGRLWWFPDGSMYVYFVPQFWKHRRQAA